MKTCAGYVMTRLLVLLLVVPVAFAQENPPQEVPVFTQQELDQILAPIALYPDSLLSQILMASTYPLEVVEAARWSRANPNLVGEQAVQAVDERRWDPSVKSLVAFPQILSMMDEKLDWMERLGDAFLAQQSQVMDTVQDLRRKADTAGHLKSSDHYRVEHQGETIVVESPYREVIYVPYYDPLVVYGPWWWPAYPPIYWAPWPGYYAYPGFVGFRWSVAIHIGPRFFFGSCNWRQRHIRVVDARPFYYHRVDRRPMSSHPVWQHDPDHRRGVAYRHPSVQAKYVRSDRPFEARREVRQHVPSSPGSRSESRYDRGKHPDARPSHVNQPTEERRGPPRNVGRDESRPNADAGHGRANPPTVRNEPNRRNDVPASVVRPNTEERSPARGIGRDDARSNPDAGPRRVGTPTVRTEPNRRNDVPASVVRPNTEERSPARSGEGRGREERGPSTRGNVLAQEKVRDFDRVPMSHSQDRGSAPWRSGSGREGGESRRR